MQVLVTGASGFLGRYLVKDLQKKGHAVTALDSKTADLTQSDSLRPFDAVKYDLIYHLAAWTQPGDFCLSHHGDLWVKNQAINTHLLSWWSEKQPQAKLIAIGTSCAYTPERALKEEYYLEGTPHESLYPYAMAKRMLYIGMRALHKQYGLSYLYVIPNTLYGLDYHKGKKQMHFIFDLIPQLLKGKISGEPVCLWGDGYQKRELVFVEDFINILSYLTDHVNNEIINIGSGREYTIRHFAKLISEYVGFNDSEIFYDATKFVGVRSKCLDIEKLKNIFPDFSLTAVEEGIEKTTDGLKRDFMEFSCLKR